MRAGRIDRSCLAPVALLGVALATGCTVGPPSVKVPDGDLASPPVVDTFADTVLTYTVNGVLNQACANIQPPDCTSSTIQTGSCPAIVVLGPNSDSKQAFTLNGGDSLIVGFQCSSITERGETVAADMAVVPTADFRIWGTATGSVPPVVQVSENATDYYPVNVWNTFLNPAGLPQTTPYVDFDLNYTSMTAPDALQVARYVSITQNNGGSVVINAIESLRATQ